MKENSSFKNKTFFWVLVFAAAVVICLCIYFLRPKERSDVALIYQDGELLYTIDLNKVTEDYEILLEREGSGNKVLVSKNSICMKDADCPDGVCVDHGELKDNSSPIVCLPNRVVIKFQTSGDEDVDVIAGKAQ